jgi:hypothetical protein
MDCAPGVIVDLESPAAFMKSIVPSRETTSKDRSPTYRSKMVPGPARTKPKGVVAFISPLELLL